MHFSIKYRYYSDILLKIITSICCNHICYCVGMVSVTSMSRYVTSSSRYQSGSSIYIRGLISWNWPRQFRLLNSLNHTCPKRIHKFQTQKFQHILFRISLIRKNSKTKTDQPTILNLCTCVRTCTLKDALMIHYNAFHLTPGRSAH